MTLYLVLDENIIVLAAKVQDDKGNLDPTCALLIGEISKKGDIIKCNDELYQKYCKKLKKLLPRFPSSAYTTKLLIYLHSAGKIQFHNHLPKLRGEGSIPHDDVYIIRLVVYTKSTLVSTDRRLEKKLIESKIMSKHGIRFQQPSQVYVV